MRKPLKEKAEPATAERTLFKGKPRNVKKKAVTSILPCSSKLSESLRTTSRENAFHTTMLSMSTSVSSERVEIPWADIEAAGMLRRAKSCPPYRIVTVAGAVVPENGPQSVPSSTRCTLPTNDDAFAFMISN